MNSRPLKLPNVCPVHALCTLPKMHFTAQRPEAVLFWTTLFLIESEANSWELDIDLNETVLDCLG
jgi:hypothetical protein